MGDEERLDAALRLTAASAPVALAVADEGGRILAANDAWERTTGWSPAALIDRRLQDLVTPGGRLFLETHCLPILKSGATVDEVSLDLVAPDGERVAMLLYAT